MFLVASVLVLTGCEEDTMVVDIPPSAPDGVFSVTGDGEVTICWNPNPEDDLAGYNVYWNSAPTGAFQHIGTVGPNATCFVDNGLTNGVTLFYAVDAFDEAGQVGPLSIEDIFDTPRPAGSNLVLFDYLGQNSNLSGYDFSSIGGAAQVWDNSSTDVYFGAPLGVPTIFASAGVDVQDFGYVDTDFDIVDWAPDAGWSGSGQEELIQGHSYIVRISSQSGGFNVAKVLVRAVSTTSVTLNWAYQLDVDNPELAPGIGGAQR
jgi:hypothetical protein